MILFRTSPVIVKNAPGLLNPHKSTGRLKRSNGTRGTKTDLKLTNISASSAATLAAQEITDAPISPWIIASE